MNKLKRFKISKHFYLDEVVDVETYDYYASRGILHKLAYKLDSRLINFITDLRDYIGSEGIVNNYWNTYNRNEGDLKQTLIDIENQQLYNWSGFRTPKSIKWYTRDSQHSVFKGIDIRFNVQGWLNKAHNFLYDNHSKYGITGLETGITWLHVDTRFIPFQTELYVIRKLDSGYLLIKDWKP